MLVQDITVQDVLRVLEPLWWEKTETATPSGADRGGAVMGHGGRASHR